MDRKTQINAAVEAALAAADWRKAPESSERWAAGARMIEAMERLERGESR